MTKIALVIAGFILAFAGASLAAYLDDLATSRFDAQSGGMVAGGEMILFIGVFAFLSLFPIGLVLFFLRSSEKFWNLFSIFAIGLALTGPMAEGYMMAVRILSMSTHSSWVFFAFFGMLRVFGSVVFGFGFVLFAFISPLKEPRRRLLFAAAIEGVLFLYVALHLLIWHKIA